MFVLWGCSTRKADEPIVYVGSMDVFGWITHLIIPALGINQCLVPCDEPSWYEVPFDTGKLPRYNVELNSSIKQTNETTPTSKREIILGTSESVGHSLWNDVSEFLLILDLRHTTVSILM